MAKSSSCDLLLRHLPSPSEAKELYSTFIVNCVFNSFLSYTAIMLNIVTIHAIRKTPSLAKPMKTLLLCLAASDLGVGFLGQPLYVSLLVKWSQANQPSCTVLKVSIIVMNLFWLASFLGVLAISVDRFLAIHLHLRYQELVTYKRVLSVVISIWLLSAVLPLLRFWPPTGIGKVTFGIVGATNLIVTGIVNWRIYINVKRHKDEIQALQMQEVQQTAQNGDLINFASFRKSAVSVFYIYLVLLVCYLPNAILLASRSILNPSIALKIGRLSSVSLIFLNSSLNPLIYCWKMRHIRHAIMNILQNISRRTGADIARQAGNYMA